MQTTLRRASVASLCTAMMLALASCKPSPSKEAAVSTRLKPVNVILITLDTVRADHLHCYGYKNIQTPTLDGLARRGVLFDEAVAQTPLTLPSHASIFTGQNPNVTGVRDTGGFALQPSSVTLAAILRKHGWDTAAFISSSVLKKIFGFNQGFSVYDDRMPKTKSGGQAATRNAGLTVDHALAWLNGHATQPFFVWVHFYDAHVPYNPPEEFRRKYPGNLYDAEIAYVDQQLGRFLDAVAKKSPAKKTLIVVLADHGESLGDHGEYGHGVFLYDSTARIVWIMAGPGVPAGVRVRQQAREIDVLPTILNLLGGKTTPAVQGTSMVPAFFGKPVQNTYSYEETLYPKINMGWSELRGIHTTHWMYIRAPRPELYDLDSDPGELHNVISTHPKEYRLLNEQLKLLSHLGNKKAETVVANQMDQQTTEQLRSLGYVGGPSDNSIQLNGTGLDPKDGVAVLKLIYQATGPGSEKLPSSKIIGFLRQALALDANNPTVYTDLGEEYQKTGQYDQAIQIYLAAIHHGAQNGNTLARLGELYLRTGRLQDALPYYRQAAQLDPLDFTVQTNLGTAYMRSGKLTEARRAFLWSLAIEKSASAYNGLGIVAMQQHQLSEARQYFSQAVHLNPKNVEAQLNLGILCTQTQDVPCARAAFRVFLARAPEADYKDMIPRVRYALARMDGLAK